MTATNMMRTITVTANIQASDLGTVAAKVQRAIADLGKPPAKKSAQRSEAGRAHDHTAVCPEGRAASVVVVIFCSGRKLPVLAVGHCNGSTLPAVVAAFPSALAHPAPPLNSESFMGAIMAIGVGLRTQFLLVTFAERSPLVRSFRPGSSPGGSFQPFAANPDDGALP